MVEKVEATPINITSPLAIHGWSHLDAVILASLTTESPLLLVGAHGTAKSLLVEKMAGALNMEMRHYNASLLNYDDLVGIPLPEDNGNKLRFVSTPGSIWDAQFVFFDEISRCRADLQNKLFPIIHERKVVGIPLSKLRHRWAAMNPPAPDDLDGSNPQGEYYLGSEALDPALADRFPFVVSVPSWADLSKEDRRQIISWRDNNSSNDGQINGHSVDSLIEDCDALIADLEVSFEERLSDYILYVIDLLAQAKLPQSPRRARMLARSTIAIHAARIILTDEEATLEDSAEIALLYGLPQNCSEVPPAPATIVAAHKQAWEISGLEDTDDWRTILQEPDPVQRVLIAHALEFHDDDLSRLITQALASEESDARQLGLATAMFLAFRAERNLTPSAWEPLITLASKVLEPRLVEQTINAGFATNTWQAITRWLDEQPASNSWLEELSQNYVLAGFPDLWKSHKWQDALETFHKDLELFGLTEVV